MVSLSVAPLRVASFFHYVRPLLTFAGENFGHFMYPVLRMRNAIEEVCLNAIDCLRDALVQRMYLTKPFRSWSAASDFPPLCCVLQDTRRAVRDQIAQVYASKPMNLLRSLVNAPPGGEQDSGHVSSVGTRTCALRKPRLHSP